MNEVTKIQPVDEIQGSTPILQADPMISMIERVAMDPTVPIDRLERMMDLRDRHEQAKREERQEEQRMAFNVAMAQAQAVMPTVAKTKRNAHTHSTYADLAAIEAQAMPVAYEHGFSVTFTPSGAENGNLLIDWCVMHRDGHAISGQASFPLDAAGSQGKSNKTGIQAMGSTMTYARRYLLCNIFNIATGDDVDGNAAPKRNENATPEQIAELNAMMGQIGDDLPQLVCDAENIKRIDDLPANRVEWIKKNLRTTAEQRGVQL